MWLLLVLLGICVGNEKKLTTKSGLTSYVDVHTPKEYYKVESSRGETWDLVMSDEFNTPGRNFAAGEDPIWTALEMPDGVNAALEYYSVNMTSTEVDPDTKRGYFQIRTILDDIQFEVYNVYARPPAYERKRMYYRSGMVQSWNKFCFQGGKMEVSAQLPGPTNLPMNPNNNEPNVRVLDRGFYPTWPGIWLLGNLARALFARSTTKMWPWSYSECRDELKESQRISACDSSPGFGLNANQGRGAPEIDIIEGGGSDISVSIQVAPGMPEEYRSFPPNMTIDNSIYCVYGMDCKTTGANAANVPTAFYTKRREYRSWYQGMRYAPNTFCTPNPAESQTFEKVKASLDRGITENTCNYDICPGSFDVSGDLGLIDGKGNQHWNINYGGHCMPRINEYVGAFLCDPDNDDPRCVSPRSKAVKPTKQVPFFEYQMDTLSANYPIQAAAYTDYLKYQVEWVIGEKGYLRWSLNDIVMFEIPAATVTDPPQNAENSNYRKLMVEEPMYFIFNTALSVAWGTTPPNPGEPCYGADNTPNAKVKAICDSFPMDMKIDYIRVWQHKDMVVGCDPASHPTREFILEHIEEYADSDNRAIEVHGGFTCNTNQDCTISKIEGSTITTGRCREGKCECFSPKLWTGPRCILPRGNSETVFGPTFFLVVAIMATSFAATMGIIVYNRTRIAPVKKTRTSTNAIMPPTDLDDIDYLEDTEQLYHSAKYIPADKDPHVL